MSRQQTRKEIVADRDALRARVAELEAAVDVGAIELETARTSAVALTEERGAIRAELDQAKQTAEAMIAEMTAGHAAALEAKDAALTEALEKGAALAVECEKQKRALADPAFVDAALVASAVVPAIADAEADAAEKAAAGEPEDSEPKTILEQYEAMGEGAERRAFWKANKRAILACEKSEAEGESNEEDL